MMDSSSLSTPILAATVPVHNAMEDHGDIRKSNLWPFPKWPHTCTFTFGSDLAPALRFAGAETEAAPQAAGLFFVTSRRVGNATLEVAGPPMSTAADGMVDGQV